MLKQKWLCLLNSVMVTLVMTAGASVASADEQSLQAGEFTTITGVASFERHRTIVPLAICEGSGCVQAKPYWSLVVKSGRSKYELDQMFAPGSEQAPDSVEVASVVIRPGSRLSLVARVDVVSRDYAILSDVQKVNLVMDSAITLAPAMPFFGWSCHSVGESRPFYVDVFQITRNGDYSMRILSDLGDDDHNVETIASFNQVQLKMDDDAIAFRGSTQRLAAELAIDQRGTRINDLESVLKVTNNVVAIDRRIPIETVIRLACNRTR